MGSYILGIVGGIVVLGIIAAFLAGFTNDDSNNSDTKQPSTVIQTPPQTMIMPAPLPIIYMTFYPHPLAPLMPMPYMPIPPYNPDTETLNEYNLKKAKYDEAVEKYAKAMKTYNLKKAKYDEAIKNYTVSQIMTVKYGGAVLRTDDLEMQIHKLINMERSKNNLDLLVYDYEISNIARSHSSDMYLKNYFDHEDSKGIGPSERGRVYGYVECGDRTTIQLEQQYDQLLQQFEAGGNTDAIMYDQLERMRNQINSAIDQSMVFDGLSENIFQNNMYERYWTTNGVITSYEWNTPEKIAKTTVDGWMNSTGHRHNILTPYYASEGIGVIISSDYKVYITQNFC